MTEPTPRRPGRAEVGRDTFLRCRDVVDKAREALRRLEESLDDQAPDGDREALFLSELRRANAGLEADLATLHALPDEVGDAWTQYSVELGLPFSRSTPPDSSVEAMSAWCRKLDEELESLFGSLAARAGGAEIEERFRAFADIVRGHARHLSRLEAGWLDV